MNGSASNFSLEYREYILPDEFPVLVLAPKNVIPHNTFDDTFTKYHFHNCIEIGICYGGEHSLRFEDSVYQITTGMFFVLSPYTMHFMNRDNNSTADDDCEYLYIKPEELLQSFYPFEIPSELLWYKNSAVPFIFSKETHPVIYDILRQIISEFREQHTNYKIAIRGLLLSLMSKLTNAIVDTSSFSPLADSYSVKYQNMSKIFPALKHIHQNFAGQLKIAELAELCHMSSSGFCTLFSALMHCSPNRYVNKLRLENACRLLHSTELPILDISIESGFSSLSNFYRMFKEHYGIPPLKWRNKKRTIRKKNYLYSPFAPEVWR